MLTGIVVLLIQIEFYPFEIQFQILIAIMIVKFSLSLSHFLLQLDCHWRICFNNLVQTVRFSFFIERSWMSQMNAKIRGMSNWTGFRCQINSQICFCVKRNHDTHGFSEICRWSSALAFSTEKTSQLPNAPVSSTVSASRISSWDFERLNNGLRNLKFECQFRKREIYLPVVSRVKRKASVLSNIKLKYEFYGFREIFLAYLKMVCGYFGPHDLRCFKEACRGYFWSSFSLIKIVRPIAGPKINNESSLFSLFSSLAFRFFSLHWHHALDCKV